MASGTCGSRGELCRKHTLEPRLPEGQVPHFNKLDKAFLLGEAGFQDVHSPSPIQSFSQTIQTPCGNLKGGLLPPWWAFVARFSQQTDHVIYHHLLPVLRVSSEDSGSFKSKRGLPNVSPSKALGSQGRPGDSALRTGARTGRT